MEVTQIRPANAQLFFQVYHTRHRCFVSSLLGLHAVKRQNKNPHRHDPNLAFARLDNAGTVGTNQPGLDGVLQDALYFDLHKA